MSSLSLSLSLSLSELASVWHLLSSADMVSFRLRCCDALICCVSPQTTDQVAQTVSLHNRKWNSLNAMEQATAVLLSF